MAPSLFSKYHLQKAASNACSTDPYKTDVFSLGITMLEAASLGEIAALNHQRETLAKRVQDLSKRYELWLVLLISKMLEFNDDARPSFEEILKTLHAQQGFLPLPVPLQSQDSSFYQKA